MTHTTRRQFLLTSSLVITAAEHAFGQTTGVASAAARFEPLRDNVGVFTARGGTIGWLISPDGVIVVDSQFPDTAATALAGIKQQAKTPIAFLINSHHHRDHTGGNQVFRPATSAVVAQRRVPALMKTVALATKTQDSQVYPDTIFEHTWSAQIGTESVSAKHYGPAHTGADIAITFHAANIVHLGDLMSSIRHPRVDRPAGGSVKGWITVIESIVKDHTVETIYIAGHSKAGTPVTVSQKDLLSFRDYLAAVLAHTQKGVASGQSAEELVKGAALPKEFGEYEGTPENAIQAAHDELTSKA
jgi:cyclase